ncbi:MAG: cytochrome c maturation protein CcmE [Bacteroidetes bacterium]|nr:cytochrome c maturation protein CcmE [Bacteroidota bacterium]
MKKTHIALLFLLAGAFVALASMLSRSAEHAGFDLASEQPDRIVRVSGTLVPGKTVDYQPEIDPNSFRFWMADKSGRQARVICYDDMPYDFEKSEEVVLTGQMKDDVFFATDLLVKCPSKYVEDDLTKSSTSAAEMQ